MEAESNESRKATQMRHWFAPARAWAASVTLLVLTGLACAPSGAQDGNRLFRLPGHVPTPRFVARVAGEVEPEEPVSLALTLPLRHERQLQQFLHRLYDPADPLYGQYLSPEEFRNRFAPGEAQYHAVAAFALSRGLTI